MWEISSGQPPFINHEPDYNLALDIINGIRPEIKPEIPLGYKSLIEQCWDADPLRRPDVNMLSIKINETYLSMPNEVLQSKSDNSSPNTSSRFFYK
ncbi:hypothetical protein C1645_781233, partial [Glomus cerebriforme]